MGNASEAQQIAPQSNQTRQANICDMTNPTGSSARCSLDDNIAEYPNKAQSNKNSMVRQGRAHKSLDIKSRQKLSLCKDGNSQSSMKLNLKRSASNDCRGIGLTQVEKTISQYRPAIIVNRPSPKFATCQSQQIIKRVPIRPRDLPRRNSTQKVIVYPQPTIVKRVPLEPKIIINPPVRSPCIINFVKQPQALSNSHHSLQSSIVTPFIPPKVVTQFSQFSQNSLQNKKLKKVALNRSHVNYNIYEKGQNNGEQSDPNKQNGKKVKFQSQLIQSRFKIENNEHLFTDPKLYSYITNKEHPFAKQIKCKYALPSYENKPEVTKKSLKSSQVQTLQINIRPATSKPLRLEQAIPDEVQSKPLIQADIYRFPTLTDFSEDSKTDNTSFIPIIRNNSSRRQQLEGEELLRYCRPKIDEMVMADLRKLPLKN